MMGPGFAAAAFAPRIGFVITFIATLGICLVLALLPRHHMREATVVSVDGTPIAIVFSDGDGRQSTIAVEQCVQSKSCMDDLLTLEAKHRTHEAAIGSVRQPGTSI